MEASVPKQVKVLPLTSCSSKETDKLFAGMESYQSRLSLSVDTSNGKGLFVIIIVSLVSIFIRLWAYFFLFQCESKLVVYVI